MTDSKIQLSKLLTPPVTVIRTILEMKKKFPNDQDLGKNIRAYIESVSFIIIPDTVSNE